MGQPPEGWTGHPQERRVGLVWASPPSKSTRPRGADTVMSSAGSSVTVLKRINLEWKNRGAGLRERSSQNNMERIPHGTRGLNYPASTATPAATKDAARHRR